LVLRKEAGDEGSPLIGVHIDTVLRDPHQESHEHDTSERGDN
jgi:hypothetical protein